MDKWTINIRQRSPNLNIIHRTRKFICGCNDQSLLLKLNHFAYSLALIQQQKVNICQKILNQSHLDIIIEQFIIIKFK